MHISKIYGNNKQRVSWGMTRRVLEALIDKHCISQFTWTGKTCVKGVRRESIKKMKTIHEVVMGALSKVDTAYTYELFKSDMVKHIIKYATNRGKNE